MHYKHGFGLFSGLLVLAATFLLAGGIWAQATPYDRIIGAVSPNGGAYLVKQFSLPRRAVATGVELVSNDTRTLFPRVVLLRGPATRLSDAPVLVEMKAIRPIAGRRVHLSFPPIVADEAQEIYVPVALPATDGIRGFGDGAGLLAKQLDEPGNSYFAMAEDGHLGRMDVEYAIDLLYLSAAKASRAEAEPSVGIPSLADARVHPNPFNPSATIELSVPRTGRVAVTIYDVAGRLVRSLLEEDLGPGVYEWEWAGRHDDGSPVATGIYVARIRIGDTILTEKLVIAK